jgi:polysaccharide deacetylase family protein (PEP-CTERM system associated)
MNILTLDIEEWFHLLDTPATSSVASWDRFECRLHANVDRLLTLLQDKKQTATCFCLGWVAQRYPEVIHKLVAQGMDIASHTSSHQLIYQQTPADFRDDVRRSMDLLQNLSGKPVRAFRAPGFSLTQKTLWAFDCLIELGIEVDSSVFPAPRGHGGFAGFGAALPTLIHRPGGVLREFPINLAFAGVVPLVFSGGGYFRLLPRWSLQPLFNAAPYVMTYFHPRDFDAAQPRLEGLGVGRRVKSYVGLKGALKKLGWLLDRYRFCDLPTAERALDWTTAPQLHLESAPVSPSGTRSV